MNITKLELCSRVSKKLEESSDIFLSVINYKKVLETFLDEFFEIMAENNHVEIRGFGCFKPVIRKKRLGRNPRTKETVEIPAYKAPHFKYSKEAQKIFDEKMKKQEKIVHVLKKPEKTEGITINQATGT